MATPQMRQISSGTATCPLFLRHLCWDTGIRGFPSPGRKPSPSWKNRAKAKKHLHLLQKYHKVHPPHPPFKAQFPIALCSSAQVSPGLPHGAREKRGTGSTHVHTCAQNTGKAASCWRRCWLCLWHTATRVQWQS